MAGPLASTKAALASILPKKKAPTGGLAQTNTYNPQATTTNLALPGYRDHLTDIFQTRQAADARSLLQTLFVQDPDVSAAVNAYLTTANTTMWALVKKADGTIDRPGYKAFQTMLMQLTNRFDYTQPSNFYFQKSLRAIAEQMRYMVLLRGGIGAELVFNKQGVPYEIRNVDLATLYWQEKAPGVYIPFQYPPHKKQGQTSISLDVPTFFVSYFHQDPTVIYTSSPFVSAINTIASRQQIINDLYRIMQMSGYPRIEIKVLEEVLKKNAPAEVSNDPGKLLTWTRARMGEIQTAVSNLRPDQALIHTDSMEMNILNEKSAGMTLDITPIITVLNAQNQAALKVMSTIIGRGESGVNTASVEARIFSLNAQEINGPVADILSQVFTLALRMQGIDVVVEIGFDEVELRPSTELEAQKLIRQNRLLLQLSLGLISDDDYHIEMTGQIAPDGIPQLSGTGFMDPTSVQAPTSGVGAGNDQSSQPNAVKRSATPSDSKSKSGK